MINTIVTNILKENNIEEISIKPIKSSGNEHLFFINDEYVLRVTNRSIENFVNRLKQVSFIHSVQKVLISDIFSSELEYNYLICNKIPGIDYIDTVLTMSDQQNADLGICISDFLDSLHSIKGSYYDIGHYIPIIPNHVGSWKDGHIKYWEYIEKSLDKIEISKNNASIFKEAFDYFESNVEALNYQQGPVLIHNDLHPKNIIVEKGVFSGVIDWECSQYGEPDFEYCHLIHWCLYPPSPEINLKPFLFSLLRKSKLNLNVNSFSKRQTIYQIEHEIMQIIWSKGKTQSERAPKIKSWLEGQVDTFLDEIK